MILGVLGLFCSGLCGRFLGHSVKSTWVPFGRFWVAQVVLVIADNALPGGKPSSW